MPYIIKLSLARKKFFDLIDEKNYWSVVWVLELCEKYYNTIKEKNQNTLSPQKNVPAGTYFTAVGCDQWGFWRYKKAFEFKREILSFKNCLHRCIWNLVALEERKYWTTW